MQTEQISSIKDPRVQEARELTSAAGRTRIQKCLLEGAESIQWALAAGLPVEHVFYSANAEKDPLYVSLHERRIPCYMVSDGILKKISDTSYLVPYIGVVPIPSVSRAVAAMGNFVLVLDRVQDHGNIGTIIRTANAFGIRDIVSTTPTLDIYYKKIITASRGRVFDVRMQHFASGAETVAALQRQGYQVVATSPYARDIQSLAPLQARPIALVVGNETEGIADDIVQHADIVVQIPMSGFVESLNVGVATGISLYELKFRMIVTMLINYIRATLGREVGATSRYIGMAFDAHLKQVTDLTSMQVVLLMMLTCDRSMTLDQVSKDTATFGDERSTLLKPLFDKGYICPQDENSILITDEGERTLAQLWSVVERVEHAVLAGFSDAEKAQFNALLKRIQANCMQIIEHGPLQP